MTGGYGVFSYFQLGYSSVCVAVAAVAKCHCLTFFRVQFYFPVEQIASQHVDVILKSACLVRVSGKARPYRGIVGELLNGDSSWLWWDIAYINDTKDG